MEKDLKKVDKLRSMIRKRRNLEQLQKRRKQRAQMKKDPPKESPPKEPPVMEIEPSAPAMENGIEVLYEEEENAGTIQLMDGPAKTVVFKKTQN